MPKTREEIEALKANWFNDAYWDIETTEGFEDHKDELLAYRQEMENEMSTALDELKKKNKTTLLDSCILLAAKHGYPMTADEATADLAQLYAERDLYDEKLSHLAVETGQLRAALDKAREVIKPFAELEKSRPKEWGDYTLINISILLGKLRAAAAWLKEFEEGA